MEKERYPGEQVGLRLFLDGLRPVVEQQLGKSTLLHHQIRKALRTGQLVDLRRARQMFNLLPRDQKREISAAIVAAADAPRVQAAKPAPDSVGPWVAFETDAQPHPTLPPAIRLDQRREASDSAVRVLVRPGTLPSVTAHTLRRIADTIEQDRRLLSKRFWLGPVAADGENVENGQSDGR